MGLVLTGISFDTWCAKALFVANTKLMLRTKTVIAILLVNEGTFLTFYKKRNAEYQN
jgi:hypothetical protein